MAGVVDGEATVGEERPGASEEGVSLERVEDGDERAGTAARVRVVIESRDDDEVLGTIGVSENVIEASWLALVDAFEHKIAKTRRADVAVITTGVQG